MRIVCPSCAAAYDVPDDRLAPGRIVKCAQCATGWAPVVAVLRTAEPAVAVPEPAAPELAPEPPARKPLTPLPSALVPDASLGPRESKAVLMGWVASFALLAALAWAAYAWRAEIMHAWPPSGRAYALLGLA